MKRQTVHVRVNDAATGQPTPVRIRFTDGEGNYHAPLGRLASFATGPNQDVGANVYVGRKAFALIDGTCEINLPPGPLIVEIHKGPEYQPVVSELTLLPGKMSMRLAIMRWTNLREQGWHSGDLRAHHLSPHAALLEAQAEDLAVVNLLATQIDSPKHSAITNMPAFSGQQFAIQSPGHGVAVNTFNHHAKLGSLALLHSHRAVYPLTFGGETGPDDWTLADWCEQCHRKKGLVVWTNTTHEAPEFRFGEPLANLILGQLDAFEITFFEDSPFDALADYAMLQNAGFHLPLVGASGKDSNGETLGRMRTYAQLQPGEPFTYTNWIEAVRAGRCYATNGPLLTWSINGVTPSRQSIALQPGEPLTIHAEAQCWLPFDTLELLWNGDVIAATKPTNETPSRAELVWQHRPDKHGWLALRCRGQASFAQWSAIPAAIADRPAKPIETKLRDRLLRELDAMLTWSREQANCPTPHDRQRLVHVFEEAISVLHARSDNGRGSTEHVQ